jgi:hypothetical protein
LLLGVKVPAAAEVMVTVTLALAALSVTEVAVMVTTPGVPGAV